MKMLPWKKIFGVDAVLTVISIVIALLLAEGAYRFYLFLNVEKINPFHYEARANPSVSFQAPPGLWTFDRDYGWNYRPEGYRGGLIKDGAFENCGVITDFNSRGNVASEETQFDDAEVRGILIGSSYTMGNDENSRYFHEILGDLLSEKLQKNVLIENVSRDSYGVVQMVDMAAVLAKRYEPDFLIIAFNTATLAMPRHWRVVKPVGNGFYNFYQVNVPEENDLTPSNSRVHEYIITDKVTAEWCDRMNAALNENNTHVLRNDPVVRAIIERYHANDRVGQSPRLAIDFTSPAVSFLYNRIFQGTPYWNMEFYSTDNPLNPLLIDDFGEDERFVAAVQALNDTGVPYYLVHIPSYPEMKSGEEWAATGTVGVPADRETSLARSLERTTGKKILSLLPYLGAPLANAAELAQKAEGSDRNWHPSLTGLKRFTEALVDMLMEKHFKQAVSRAGDD